MFKYETFDNSTDGKHANQQEMHIQEKIIK